jgi:hypothetical protein
MNFAGPTKKPSDKSRVEDVLSRGEIVDKLKSLVLYREHKYNDRDFSHPSIENNKFILSEALAGELVNYLDSGVVLFEFVSPTTDPYNDSDVIPNKVLSDGVYVWDWVVINWVVKYRIRLPDLFLAHVKNQKKNKNLINGLNVVSLVNRLKEGVEEVYL